MAVKYSESNPKHPFRATFWMERPPRKSILDAQMPSAVIILGLLNSSFCPSGIFSVSREGIMLSKPKNPPSFAEACIVSADKRWKEHWLHRVQKIVHWKSFARELEKLYNPNEGRRPVPVTLFRCLLLAEWNGLSDRALEEALEFRIDFEEFAGLEVDAAVPDAMTFVVFRDPHRAHPKRLFERLDRQLRVVSSSPLCDCGGRYPGGSTFQAHQERR